MQAKIPEDYIAVADYEPERKDTAIYKVRQTIKRFYDQEFQYLHVVNYLHENDLQHYRLKNLKELVRRYLSDMAQQGELEIISKGSRGKASVYKNKSN